MWALLPVVPMAKAVTPHIRSWTHCCIQLYSMNLVQTKWIMKFPICSNKRIHVRHRLIACTYCRGKPNAVLQPWCIAMAPCKWLKHLLRKRILWPICSMMINLLCLFLSCRVSLTVPRCKTLETISIMFSSHHGFWNKIVVCHLFASRGGDATMEALENCTPFASRAIMFPHNERIIQPTTFSRHLTSSLSTCIFHFALQQRDKKVQSRRWGSEVEFLHPSWSHEIASTGENSGLNSLYHLQKHPRLGLFAAVGWWWKWVWKNHCRRC